jgi:hypothetical protein
MQQMNQYTMTCRSHTKATFQSLVDAIIPNTPMLGVKKGREQAAGGMKLQVYTYIIWQLDHFIAVQMGKSLVRLPLSHVTAYMLDVMAAQLISTGKVKELPSFTGFLGGGIFSTLLPKDRIRTLEFFDEINLNLGTLPPPYQNNPGLIKQVVAAIISMAMFGYYSEWPGYETTRLFPPDDRRLESFPPDWVQAGYPGPAYGYRDFRGFLLTFPKNREDIDEN